MTILFQITFFLQQPFTKNISGLGFSK